MDTGSDAKNFLLTHENFELLFEHMLNGFAFCKMLFDSSGNPEDFIYLSVNPAFGVLTGLQNVIGKKVTEIIPDIKTKNPELMTLYGRVATTGKPEKIEIYFKPLLMYFSIAVYSPEKEYFVAVFENITERKKIEEALREREERLNLAIKATHLGVWDLNITTNAVYVSPEMLNLTGVSQLDGTVDAFKKIIHPEDIARVMAEITKSILGGSEFETEFRVVRPDGRVIFLSTYGHVMFDQSHKPQRIVGTAQDITDRRTLTEELQVKTHELEKFVEMSLGTEQQISELKNKIQELQEKAGKI